MPWPKKNMIIVALLSASAGVGAALLVPAMLTAKPSPFATAAAPDNLLRIDGDQSELRLEGKDTGLHADKDGVRLRTSAGNFDLRW